MIELNLKLITYTSKIVFLQAEKIEEVHSFLYNNCNLSADNYYLRCNGNEVLNNKDLTGSVQVIPRLRGGKGGFGSMLRAIGAQIEKTTNREACRDLSGRRLRDINEEQRLKKWISQQAEREREIEERRKKKLEKLSSEPKHEFEDKSYLIERSEMSEKLNDAFEQGVQASSSNVKRKVVEDIVPVKKKKKLILDFDEFSSSEDTGEESGSDVSHKEESNIKVSTEDDVNNEDTTSSSNDRNTEEVKAPCSGDEGSIVSCKNTTEDTTEVIPSDKNENEKDDEKVNTVCSVKNKSPVTRKKIEDTKASNINNSS